MDKISSASRGPGRPRKSPEDLTSQLAIRLTDADRKTLQSLAANSGVSISSYIVGVLKAHITFEEAQD